MIQRVSPEQALDQLKEGARVIDIRDEASFKQGHIQGATHLDSHNLPVFLDEADRDHPYIICCYHGHSSLNAAQYLLAQDFTHIASLDGGFELWRQRYPEHCSKADQDN